MMEYKKILLALSISAIATFSGCDDSNDNNNDNASSSSIITSSSSSIANSSSSAIAAAYTYSFKIINLTAGQPMSPVLITTNDIYSVGESATEALEMLAEGGNNSMLLDENGVSTDTPVGPGASASLELSTNETTVSVASMLVNTNDAFAAMKNVNLSALNVGDKTNFYLNVFDAGTEANTETASTIPGPVSKGEGEGFNATRDDNNRVSAHTGVISKDDGFMTSDLTSMHRFDNPAAIVIVTRTK